METTVVERVHPRAVDLLLLVLDLAGAFLFSLEGALSAMAGHLDFLDHGSRFLYRTGRGHRA